MLKINNSVQDIKWKFALIAALLLAVIALISTPLGPFGVYWRPSEEIPITNATNVQLILFLILNIAEALSFGFGISFLIFGYPIVRAIQPVSLGLSRAAHLSIGWLLINWWAHDSLHIHVGMKLDGLLGIEYGFHVTIIIAGVILAIFFMTILHQKD